MLISGIRACIIDIYFFYWENRMDDHKKQIDNRRLYKKIGIRLKKIRHRFNYTQEQFAEILEVSVAYYGKVERGIYGLSLAKLVLLYEKLDIDITYLLTGNAKIENEFEKMFVDIPFDKQEKTLSLMKDLIDLIK